MEADMNQIRAICAENRKSGGIYLLDLHPGTKLKISTKNSTYDIVVRCGILVDIRGGNQENGEERYPEFKPVVLHCSVVHGNQKLAGWIGFESKIEIIEVSTGLIVQTSPVSALKVTAADDSWTYDLECSALNYNWKSEGF